MPKFEKSKGYKMKGFSGFKSSPAKQEEPSAINTFMAMGKTLGNSKVSKSTIADISSNYTYKPVSDKQLASNQAKSAERKVEKGKRNETMTPEEQKDLLKKYPKQP